MEEYYLGICKAPSSILSTENKSKKVSKDKLFPGYLSVPQNKTKIQECKIIKFPIK